MLAFVHSYKTAGTTFTTLLRQHFGLAHFDRPGFRERALRAEDLRRLKRVYPALQSIAGHPVRPYSNLKEAAPEIRYYSFLRDPLKRSISHLTWYLRYKAHDGILFDDFEQLARDWCDAEWNQNRQCRHLHPEGRFAQVKDIIESNPFLLLQVEEFDRSLLLFRDWANQPKMKLAYTRFNTNTDSYERIQDTHPEYLERIRAFRKELPQHEELLNRLREANQEDQQLIDWMRTEIWPRQIEAYSGDMEADLTELQQEIAQGKASGAEPWLPRFYRNAVFKPLRRFLLPQGEMPDIDASPWT